MSAQAGGRIITPCPGSIRAALTEFEIEQDRARQDETYALADLIAIVDEIVDVENPKAAYLAKAIVRQEHATERLRDIRADCEWRIRCAFRKLREALR